MKDVEKGAKEIGSLDYGNMEVVVVDEWHMRTGTGIIARYIGTYLRYGVVVSGNNGGI